MPTSPLEHLERWVLSAGQVGAGQETETQIVDRIRALEELKAVAAAEQARLTAHLYDVRQRREAEQKVPAAKRCAGLGTEIALARRVSPHQGNRHLGVALALTRELPQTFAALSSGEISEWRATLVVRETAVLSAAHRTEVDRQLARHLTGSGWGDRQVANEARRLGYRLDPSSALRRVRGANADRHVSLRPAPDTMTYLTGFLPVAQGVACQVALMKQADSLKAQGDRRTRAQIMADTLVARVTGRAQASSVPVEVNLVMADKTLFGGSQEPAHLVGYGALPAELARRLVHEADKAWVRRLFTHPDTGALVATDSRRRCFPRRIRQQLRLTNDTCAVPGCDAPVRHADHVNPVKHGGPTTAANAVGLCEGCNYTKDLPGWTATLHTWSDQTRVLDLATPTGHRHRSRAPDPPGAPDPVGRRLRDLLAG